MNVQEQAPDGTWRPAIPLPFYRGRLFGQFQCAHPVYDGITAEHCGRRFRTMEAYREHYRAAHPPTTVPPSRPRP